MEQRDKFGTRLGFILVSAGCAIGLGNVWRFPFITGQYGGAIFVLIYLIFLFALGLPVMSMEFAVGRASRRSIATSMRVLEPTGSKWHLFSYIGIMGNYLLMMFYTTIAGWMFLYLFLMAKGEFSNKSAEEIEAVFNGVLASPGTNVFWMITVCIVGFGICAIGLKNGVERITKLMMSLLFVIMIVLVIRAVTLPGAMDGIAFYLAPDFESFRNHALYEVIFAAMGQAVFTLSIGMGSMSIFGSYIDKDKTLLGESIIITILDTTVAFLSGFIIFPSCFAFGVNPGAGPGLVFITLPNVFNSMWAGRVFGTLFFLLLAFAALSTVTAIFENIVGFAGDLFGTPRKKAVIINIVLIIILSLPCSLGFNVLSGFAPLGEGTGILDLEDFIVSNNILPLGSLVFVIFCVTRYGWGFDNFLAEANTGQGAKFPKALKFYLTFILPIFVLAVFILGYIDIFG